MAGHRRDFLRAVGFGAAAATAARWRRGPTGSASWGGGARESPDLRRFVAGVRVGDARSHRDIMVLWLHRDGDGAAHRIATLEEARGRSDLIITERDQATVPDLIVENRGKAHVLLLGGEILVGGKQNRVLGEDVLLPPGSGPRNLGVYCVEQGRWAGRAKDFDAKGTFAAPALRSRLMEKADQAKVWAEVDRYARAAGAPSPTRSYQEVYEKAEVKDHLKAVEDAMDSRPAPGVLGAAVFVGDRLGGLDLFHDPGLFARQWAKLLRAQALDAYRRPHEHQPEARRLRDRVEEILARVAKAEGALRGNAGVGHLFEFRVDPQRGSALVFEGHVIHAAVL